MTDDAAEVLVGRIVKPHGIRGEVVVELLSDVPDRLDQGVRVRVDGDEMLIAGSRPHQGRLLVAFEGLVDRSAAETLRGKDVMAAPLADLELDVYLGDELLGLSVRTEDGRDLGRVVALVELPAAAGYDLLEVERAEGTWLLPATDEYVDVDVDDGGAPVGLVVVDAPAGLLPDDQDGGAP